MKVLGNLAHCHCGQPLLTIVPHTQQSFVPSDQYLPQLLLSLLPFRDFASVRWFCLPVSGLFNAHRIHVVANDSISFF